MIECLLVAHIVRYDKYNIDLMSWMNYYVGIFRKDDGS